MTEATNAPTEGDGPRELAARVDELLETLSGQLQVASNPHMVARRSLGVVGHFGWTRSPYTNEAFRIWGELAERSPDDVETLHHLAIMHHARAFDLEAGKQPSRADKDWEAALDYWWRLWRSDAFWQRFAASFEGEAKTGKIVEAVKSSWPVQLLKVHFDIALDPATTERQRIAYHVGLALKSPFPDEAKDQVRQEVYGRWVASVNPQVWQSDVLAEDVIAQGTEVIQGYLERDPGCVCSLADLLRLQERLLRAWHHQVNALDEQDPKRDALIRQICDEAPKWGPYLRQLLDVVESLAPDVRQKLRFWYYAMGVVHVAASRYRDAAGFLESAGKAAEDDDERRRQEDLLGEALALEARDVARDSDPAEEARAKRLADELRQRPGLSIRAHRFLANAYLLIHEHDAAEELCRRALDTELDEIDFRRMEEAEREKEGLREMLENVSTGRRRHRARQVFEKASTAMQEKSYDTARGLLAQAIGLDADFEPAYFLRCQCNLATLRHREAQADLKTFQRMVDGKAAPDEQTREAVRRLEADCRELAADVRTFGAEALRLRREAARAFNADDFDEAEATLRRALRQTEAGGKTVLRKELAQTLANRAGREVNRIIENKSASDRKKGQVFKRAETWLSEAGRLDPSDKHVQQNLSSLRKLLEGVEAASKLERDYGGRPALELQQQAVRAYNADRVDEAIRHLRQAVTASNKPAKLQAELSEMLTGAAVMKVNEMSEPSASVLGEAEKMLKEAVKLDRSNARARENLTRLSGLTGAMQKAASAEREMGGQQAMELHREAVTAFNSGNLDRAVDCLRRAIGMSRNSATLEKELSQVLAAAAVDKINRAGSSVSRSTIDEARDMLLEALRLDANNEHAKQNLMILMGGGGGR